MRWLFMGVFPLLGIVSCSLTGVQRDENERLLEGTVSLAREVKDFGKTLGIQPSEALSRSGMEKPSHSIIWVWLQRFGTLALRTPIDVRTEMLFSTAKERAPLKRVYQFGRYSVYFRQGDQFGDAKSVITPDFAKDSLPRKVEVILHEDLHDDKNFNLVWEYEESLVNPLGILAALEFFESKGDRDNAKEVWRLIQEKREVSRQLNTLVQQAVKVFQVPPFDDARKKVVDLLPSYPSYYRFYEKDLQDLQDINVINLADNKVDKTPVLEAKISHDFVYYRYFDRIVTLYEKMGGFQKLLKEIKQVQSRVSNLDVSTVDVNSKVFEKYWEVIDEYLSGLEKK